MSQRCPRDESKPGYNVEEQQRYKWAKPNPECHRNGNSLDCMNAASAVPSWATHRQWDSQTPSAPRPPCIREEGTQLDRVPVQSPNLCRESDTQPQMPPGVFHRRQSVVRRRTVELIQDGRRRRPAYRTNGETTESLQLPLEPTGNAESSALTGVLCKRRESQETN